MLDENARRVFSSKALNYFDELTKNMSYTKTAQSLGITQPALTQQIKKIEKVVGAPLFYSMGKQIYLTDAGETLLKSTHEMFDLINDVTVKIQQDSNSKSGIIRIGILSTIASSVVDDFIVYYNKINPDIELDLLSLSRNELWDNMQNNKIDLAIMYLPEKNIKNWKHFRTHKIMDDKIMLIHNDDRLKDKKSVTYKEAIKLPWASYLEGYYISDLIINSFTNSLVDLPQVVARFSSPYQLLKFTDRTENVYTALPESFCLGHLTKNTNLYQVALEPNISFELSFVYKENKEKIGKIKDIYSEWEKFLLEESYKNRLISSSLVV
ncbi:LysR family transcriptional regulator [Companilactobacillus metriopterae]|uniref:LysR family transcriptional regulator n=1 Tax=Companilactobacillus metriopterae TaxID=1909267 RepID=UPI00100B57E3|nr:LysR substrate-binding domain-containing protein [Companilactobacillus metriopterae]